MADCIRELCVEKNAQIHFFWSILIKKAIKKVSDKILFDNNMTHLLQKKKTFTKNVYDRWRKTLSKALDSLSLNCLCSSFKFFG